MMTMSSWWEKTEQIFEKIDSKVFATYLNAGARRGAVGSMICIIRIEEVLWPLYIRSLIDYVRTD